MKISELDKIFLNQAKFRLTQARRLIFKDLIADWREASVFPKKMREELNCSFPLGIDSEVFVSQDLKSARARIILSDSLSLETTLMVHRDGRNTACLSSQIGCPLACQFCLSGLNFKRNLSSDEILLQALWWSRYLKEKKLGRLSNIVFMGSGEAFLNYDNVFSAIDVLNDPDYFNISSRRISLSTIGLIPGIRKMAKEQKQANLAISLHFTSDQLRSKMMPGSKKYPLAKLFEAVDYYIEKTKRKVMFEYLLLKGINDSKAEAEKLAQLMAKPLYAVNIIKYNKTGAFKASETETIRDFKKILLKNQVEVVERRRFNQDVAGACGQLSS